VPVRPCLDCGKLTSGTRCPTHQRSRTQARNARTRRDTPERHRRAAAVYVPAGLGDAAFYWELLAGIAVVTWAILYLL